MRMAVICGGRSPEHAVSVVSARSILREADPARFEAVPFGITRGGRWLTPDETRRRLISVEAGETDTLGEDSGAGVLAAAEVLAALADVDVVFPIVHGPIGEDGTLQGLCELAEKPYVGSGVAASAVGMDKVHMRAVFAAAGLPQPKYAVLRDEETRSPSSAALHAIEREVGYPCFVKPANGGSSLGVSKAGTREDLLEATALAARYDRKVLVEEAIEGREVECAVLGNARSGAIAAWRNQAACGVLHLRGEVRRRQHRTDRPRPADRGDNAARTGGGHPRLPRRRLRRDGPRRFLRHSAGRGPRHRGEHPARIHPDLDVPAALAARWHVVLRR